MMVSNIIYKLTSFANYSGLTYNKDDAMKIMSSFNDPSFVPVVVPEVQQDGTVIQRMQFTAQNGFFTISIDAGRIDIQVISSERHGFSSDQMEKIKDYLNDSLKKLYNVFEKRAAEPYRLAWNTSYVYFEINEQEKDLFRNKFLQELDFFKQNKLDDTIARFGTQRVITINNNPERINVLATVSSFISNQNTDFEVDGFKIDYDINTWQGNHKNRFKQETFIEFIDKAMEIQMVLNKEMLP